MEIYVGNLPTNIQMQELSYLFQNYGRILFIDIKSRCLPQFAFILFDNAGSAFNAVQALQDVVYNGHKLEVRLLTHEEPNKMIQETEVLPPGTFQLDKRYKQPVPPGTFQNVQQMPLYKTPSSTQLNERDKQSGKKKKLPTPMHRTLTIVEQMPDVVPTNVPSNISVKRDKSPAKNNVQKNNLTQRATIKILTPDILNKSIADKQKAEQQKLQQNNVPMLFKKTRRSKVPPTPPTGAPGGLDDTYRRGLTGAGLKWYLRYLLSGFPKKEARIKAGTHTHLARGVSEKKARYISEKDFDVIFGKN